MGTATARSANIRDMSVAPQDRREPILRKVMPELDSIRGLAILGVLFTHGFYYATTASLYHSAAQRLAIYATMPGRMGVNLFFVLSGFLITGILIDSRAQFSYYSRFYIRRALRILPVYYLVLIILLATHFSNGPFVVLSLIYLSNLTPLWGIPLAYSVLWSLAVEEHFYLFWPTLVKNVSLTGIAVCSAAIVILSPLVRLLSFHLALHNGVRSYDFNLYTWNASDGLACGALVATLLRLKPVARRQLWQIAAALLALAIAIFAVGFPLGILTRERPVGAALQPTPWNFAFVALLLAFLLVGTSDRKALVVRPVLRFFGEISYGLYLFHVLCFDAYDALVRRYYPALVGAVRNDEYVHTLAARPSFSLLCLRFVVAAAVAILVSYASRRWFENPFLRMKERFS
jgi:peptidoglycan/LPS O-acetylase OafA/YrhL